MPVGLKYGRRQPKEKGKGRSKNGMGARGGGSKIKR
jgi:hypothetical protein